MKLGSSGAQGSGAANLADARSVRLARDFARQAGLNLDFTPRRLAAERALCGFVLLRERSSAPSLHPGAGGKSRPVVTAAGRGAWQDAPSGDSGQLLRVRICVFTVTLSRFSCSWRSWRSLVTFFFLHRAAALASSKGRLALRSAA
jgi:hypothetical protein